MHLLGFIVNPIAGMGGRVGLKGTDNVVEEAVRRGAEPVAGERASQMVRTLIRARELYMRKLPVTWLTVSGKMGADILEEAGVSQNEYRIVYTCSEPTTREDTKKACSEFQKRAVDLIVFCGGDGTARDIYQVVDADVPVLGIPAGVKMYSGVFGVNPESVAEVILAFIDGTLRPSEVEIMDLDEALYRNGQWSVKLHGIAVTPFEAAYVQSSKAIIRGPSEEEIKKEIAAYITEGMNDNTLYILGPGSTVAAIAVNLGIDKTLLGVDAVFNRNLVAQDANEKTLLALLDEYEKVSVIVSPIGAQGFILGRGNLQLSPEVIERIGIDNITVVSTPSKLQQIDALRIDTQDKQLDEAFLEKRYIRVIVGYHTMAVRNIKVHLQP